MAMENYLGLNLGVPWVTNLTGANTDGQVCECTLKYTIHPMSTWMYRLYHTVRQRTKLRTVKQA